MPRAQALVEVRKIAKAEGVSELEAWRLFRSRVGTANTRKELARAGERYREGERDAIVGALYLCAWHDYPLPTWLKDEVERGCEKYLLCESRTLDEAFGIERPKSMNVKAMGERMKNANMVYLTVNAIRKRKRISGSELFEVAGEELGMGARQVKEIYHSIMRELKRNS